MKKKEGGWYTLQMWYNEYIENEFDIKRIINNLKMEEEKSYVWEVKLFTQISPKKQEKTKNKWKWGSNYNLKFKTIINKYKKSF